MGNVKFVKASTVVLALRKFNEIERANGITYNEFKVIEISGSVYIIYREKKK